MFEWGDIRVFLAVAREGSTLAASKVLGMNQTTVSRRIQSLEHALGLDLFERDTRGYTLTAMGSAMVDVAGQMQASAESVQLRAATLKRMTGGTIRISAAPSTIERWVVPITISYREKNPGVSFEIDSSSHRVSLEAGEAEVAFRASDEVSGDTLIARKFGMATWGVYCHRSYVREHGMPQSFEDLKGRPLHFYSDDIAGPTALLRFFKTQIEPDQIVATYNSVTTIAGSLYAGTALAPLPMVEGEAIPDLICCFSSPEMSMPIWLVASREAYQLPVVRDFMKHAVEAGLKDGVTLV